MILPQDLEKYEEGFIYVKIANFETFLKISKMFWICTTIIFVVSLSTSLLQNAAKFWGKKRYFVTYCRILCKIDSQRQLIDLNRNK